MFQRLKRRSPHCRYPYLLPLIMGGLFSLITLGFWHQLVRLEQTHLSDRIAADAQAVQVSIEAHINEQVQALERMGDRWMVRGGTPRPEWESDVHNYLRDFNGYQAIEWVDPQGTVVWVVPLQGNEAAVGFNLGQESRRRKALEQARNRRQTVFTETIHLVQGGAGFLIIQPLYLQQPRPNSSETFDGYLLGVFQVEAFFEAMLPRMDADNYRVTITDDQSIIYQQALSQPIDHAHNYTAPTSLDGAGWTLTLTPTMEWVEQLQSPLPTLLLVVGMGLSWLLAIALGSLQLRQRQLQRIYQINRQLSREIYERQQVEATQRALLDALPDLLIRMDRSGHYLSVEANPTFPLVTPLETMRGKPYSSDSAACRCQLPPGTGDPGPGYRPSANL